MDTREARILVVDDDRQVAAFTAMSLGILGAAGQVATACSAGDAYRQMLAAPFDLVISDLRMPGMDGLELLEQIGSHFPGVRLVLVTGDSNPGIEGRARRAGVHRCVSKPYPVELLGTIVCDLLAGRDGQVAADAAGSVAVDLGSAGERSHGPGTTAPDRGQGGTGLTG